MRQVKFFCDHCEKGFKITNQSKGVTIDFDGEIEFSYNCDNPELAPEGMERNLCPTCHKKLLNLLIEFFDGR